MSILGTTWERTDDVRCHIPKFEIKCRYCDRPMLMRFSDIDIRDLKQRKIFINYVGYKCPYCAWIARFDLEDTYEYLLGILKQRNGILHFVPDSDEWARESPEIRKQLAALNYIGR